MFNKKNENEMSVEDNTIPTSLSWEDIIRNQIERCNYIISAGDLFHTSAAIQTLKANLVFKQDEIFKKDLERISKENIVEIQQQIDKFYLNTGYPPEYEFEMKDIKRSTSWNYYIKLFEILQNLCYRIGLFGLTIEGEV